MKLMSLFSVLLLISTIGCGSSTTESTTAKGKTSATLASTSTSNDSETSQFELAGLWVGTTTCEPELVKAKLATCTGDEQTSLIAKIQSFESMKLAVNYADNQTMEAESEMIVDGKVLVDASTGSWEIAGLADGKLSVTIHEVLGSETKSSTKVYQVFDKDTLLLFPALDPALQELKPMITFIRQDFDLSDVGALSAEAAVETQTK